MSSTIRMVGAWIGFALVLVVLATAQPDAAPTFSDWALPANLGPTINSPFDDFGPAMSKDGLNLYFTSNRPTGFGGTDIWVSQRPTRHDAWGPPMNVGAVLNTAGTEGPPELSRDGHWLLFNSDRLGGLGDQDIWVSWREHTHDEFGWEPPFNLGAGVNSAFFDAGPTLLENDEGGTPLLFFTSNRPRLGSPTTFDIYVSHAAPNGLFLPATLVPELSSPATEQRPSVRFDGLEIFFHSNRPGSVGNDLWVSSRQTVFDLWSPPANLGVTVNSASADQQPHVAADRQTLLFASNRPVGFGGLDLYVTTRTKHKP